MKRKLVSVVILMAVMMAYCVHVSAITGDAQPYSVGSISGGLLSQGNGRYLLWGSISGDINEALSIRAELRTSSGSLIASAYGNGKGPSVVTEAVYVNLSSGTYFVYLYGTTSTNTPSRTLTVRV